MTIEIPLANGRGVARVDDGDAGLVAGFRWRLSGGYAVAWSGCRPNRVVVAMHRLVLSAPPRVEVDHRDRDKLNNRRSNLRLATTRQNHGNVGRQSNNTSGYKGVCWVPRRGWVANISDHGRLRHLGYHATAEAAARAYDRAALDVFGEFASLNFNP